MSFFFTEITVTGSYTCAFNQETLKSETTTIIPTIKDKIKVVEV